MVQSGSCNAGGNKLEGVQWSALSLARVAPREAHLPACSGIKPTPPFQCTTS